MSVRKNYLFLQGPRTPFFTRLAECLRAEGHGVHRINFCTGDALYWWARNNWNYDANLSDLQNYLADKFLRLGITDQILFGDRRPVHQEALALAKKHGIRTHVFEEGYFRPYWLTLEREGVNGHSMLPRDPDWYREVGAHVPDYGEGKAFTSSFQVRALHDVAYNLANAANPLLYPAYRSHVPFTVAKEYAGYVRRFARLQLVKRNNLERVAQLTTGRVSYFLLLLQLNSDAQIRHHSRFNCMLEVIDYVMHSFALHAPPHARLVIKNHPLDMALLDYAAAVRDAAKRLQLEGRVDFLETGDLVALLSQAKGAVTVNSTAGALALQMGCPTMALSEAIYSLPGLTFQGSLNAFWHNGIAPERELFRNFRNVVIHATQINGGFYSRSGIELGVKNSLASLDAAKSPLEALL